MKPVEIAEGPPRRPRSRAALIAIFAVGFAAVVALAHEIMLPFVLAAVIAYVLTPVVAWFERRRVPRAAAILIVYVLVLGGVAGFVRASAPRFVQEIASLRRELPETGRRVQTQWVPVVQAKLRAWGAIPPPKEEETFQGERERETAAFVARPRPDGSFALEVGSGVTVAPTKSGAFLVEHAREERHVPFDLNRAVADSVGKSLAFAEKNAVEVFRIGRDIALGVGRGIFVFGLTLMLAAYMMLTREKIVGFFVSLARPGDRGDVERLLWRVDRGLSGVVRGQIIICLVNGVLSAIGFALVGLKYWPVLALVATVMSLVPIFGSIASSIPAVAIGLTQSPGIAIFVLVWIIGIHQLEANFLNPKIMGDQAKIHPVLVVFALLVGEHFFHTAGALLAVPCMSIAQSVFVHFRGRFEAADPDFDDEPKPSLPPPKLAK